MKATITAINEDGTTQGWPGVRVVRYEGEDGSWAWCPGVENYGDVIEIDNTPPTPRTLEDRLGEMLATSRFTIGDFTADHVGAPHGTAHLDADAIAAIVKFISEALS